MGELIRFVRKSERERARPNREARAIYDSVFRRLIPSTSSGTRHRKPYAHRRSCHRAEGGIMMATIAVLCSLSSPANCHEQTVTTSGFCVVSMQCRLSGAPQLAQSMNQHPTERLPAWRCVFGKRMAGELRVKCQPARKSERNVSGSSLGRSSLG
jgi:hypothetical protein